AAVGLLGYFLTIFCIQIGISLTGASMAALLNALTPVSVTLLAALVLKEPITPARARIRQTTLTGVMGSFRTRAGAAVITLGAGPQGDDGGGPLHSLLGAGLRVYAPPHRQVSP